MGTKGNRGKNLSWESNVSACTTVRTSTEEENKKAVNESETSSCLEAIASDSAQLSSSLTCLDIFREHELYWQTQEDAVAHYLGAT